MRVLEEENRPMTTVEILNIAISRQYLKPTGKTPTATLSAKLYMDAKRSSPKVRRVSDDGPTRALRGSVRWSLS